jgi:hypothetical protein
MEIWMTRSEAFTAEEWDTVLEGPTSAGIIVATAERGGSFREAFAMAKVYGEARREHGESELLDEVAAHKPELERPRAKSAEEVKEHGLQRIRDAVALVEQKATAQELDEYRRFVASVANRVAEAKKERGGEGPVSEGERAAIAEIEAALAG